MKHKRLQFLLALLITAATGAWAQTTVNGLFTVNADGDQVQFASGNLRYTSGAWSFFDHQYDYYAEYSAGSWDKFGWSTSGTTYGMSTSTNDGLYKGDFVDWGNAVGTGWRTLSNDEWAYVVNTRSGSTIGTTANARFAKAKVNDVQGVILFPDTYTHPDGVTAPTGVNATGNTGWNGNSYDATAWALMESAGCVFLPTAGGRYNYQDPTLVVNAGNEGCYWSSTSNNSTANFLNFKQNTFYPSNADSPRSGYSVRLVKTVTTYSVSLKDGTQDAKNWTITSGEKSVKGDVADGLTGLSENDAVTLKYNGRLKVKSVTATTDAAPAATVVDLSTVSGENYIVTGDVILTGTPTESPFYIKYGGDDYEVTLDNVNSAGNKQVLVDGDRHNINIKLKGTSRLKEIYTGDMNNNTVTIGEAAAGGTLILTGSTDPIRAKTFTINGGTVKSQATGDNWAVYLNNSVGVLTINGGALYLAAGDDETQAVKGTVSGTLYGWNGSAWVTYTNQRYATTDNTTGNPTGWTW